MKIIKMRHRLGFEHLFDPLIGLEYNGIHRGLRIGRRYTDFDLACNPRIHKTPHKAADMHAKAFLVNSDTYKINHLSPMVHGRRR